MNKDVILRVEDLHLDIQNGKKTTQILHNVSFTLAKGERLGIVGTSGAGKSMTMYAITSLLPERTAHMAGKICYIDQPGNVETDILQMRQKERRKFCSRHAAIILQDSINALNPYMKLEHQLEETAMLHHDLSKSDALVYVRDALVQVGLKCDRDFLDHYPHEFSGGMRQRIAIAMALMSPAKILVADEPTTSLDAVNQMRFVELVNQICDERNLAYIFISHNLGLVSMMCEHVAVVQNGTIIERGSVQEVFSSPKAEHTRTLVEGTRALLRR